MKTFLDYSLTIIGIIMLALGCALVWGSLTSSGHESKIDLVYGISSILSGLFVMGFSVVVHAAYVYIEKNEATNEASEE